MKSNRLSSSHLSLFTLFFLSFCIPLSAQTLLNNYYGDSGQDQLQKVIYDANSNAYYGVGQLDGHAMFCKLNTDGSVVHTTIYESSAVFVDIIESTEKDFMVIGEKQGPNNSQYTDFYVAKIAKNGALTWARIYDYPGRILTKSLVKSTNDEWFLSSRHAPPNSGIDDHVVAKIDGSGNLLWSKVLDGGSDEDCNHSVSDGNGGIYLIGGWYDASSWVSGALTRIDANGNILWSRSLNDPNTDINLFGASRAANGDLLLTGWYQQVPFTSGHLALFARCDSLGNLIWARTLERNGQEIHGYEIIEDANGDILASGKHRNTSPPSQVYLAKFDANGNYLWAKDMGITSTVSRSFHVIPFQTNNNLLLFSNYLDDPILGLGGGDAQLQVMDYGFNGCPPPNYAVTLDSMAWTTSFYQLGFQDTTPPVISISNAEQLSSMKVITLCSRVGLEDELPAAKLQLFPNPTAGNLEIRLEDSQFEGKILTLTNMNGQVVAQTELNRGFAQLDLSLLPKGIYFLRAPGLQAQKVMRL